MHLHFIGPLKENFPIKTVDSRYITSSLGPVEFDCYNETLLYQGKKKNTIQGPPQSGADPGFKKRGGTTQFFFLTAASLESRASPKKADELMSVESRASPKRGGGGGGGGGGGESDTFLCSDTFFFFPLFF